MDTGNTALSGTTLISFLFRPLLAALPTGLSLCLRNIDPPPVLSDVECCLGRVLRVNNQSELVIQVTRLVISQSGSSIQSSLTAEPGTTLIDGVWLFLSGVCRNATILSVMVSVIRSVMLSVASGLILVVLQDAHDRSDGLLKHFVVVWVRVMVLSLRAVLSSAGAALDWVLFSGT